MYSGFEIGIRKIMAMSLLCVVCLCDVNGQPTESKSVAIVELFTSEGCSSCPLADETLQEMTGILQKEGKNVLPLAFHVTYWNRLGWIDPYSQEIFTERQKKYVNTVKFSQLYTPQAVVNGQQEFVGSDPISFRNLVTEAVSKADQYSIQACVSNTDTTRITYQVNKQPKNVILNVAIVENYSENHVSKGENKNRTLKHYNIVRVFNTYEIANPRGEVDLQWPEGLKKENSKVILYLQQPKSLKIVGGCVAGIKCL